MVCLPHRRRSPGLHRRQSVRAVIGLLLGSLTCCTVRADEPPVPRAASVSLREAIQLALLHNRSLEKAGLDREVQRFDLRVAETEFTPRLDLLSSSFYNPVKINGASTTTRTSDTAVAITERVPTGARVALLWDNYATGLSTAPKAYDSTLSLQLDQPLLRGGGLPANLANLRIARLSEQTNILEFKRNVIVTITNVIFAYRNLQQSQRQVEVSEVAVTRAQEQLRINRALVSSGILAPAEIIQTEADIANQEFNLLTAQANRDSARFALVKILDVDRDTPFESMDPIVLPTFTLDLETCRRLAFANRPDFQQALQSQSASELSVVSARNNQLWYLNLSSRYKVTGGDTSYGAAIDRSFTRANEDWNVGVTLQVPFGDLTRKQGYLHARNRASKSAIDVTEITDNIEIEVRDALRTIELSTKRVRVAAVARELAEKKLEIEKGKLQVGRTTNFAVVLFQNDLVTARLNEIGTQIAYLNSISQLEQTLGTTLAVWGIRIEDLGNGSGPARALSATP